MAISPRVTYTYYVFLASPGDVGDERQQVRQFFERYNRHHARLWNVRFEIIDWENYSTIGVGRPQELITRQTLEKHRDSLALVLGVMAQRFGMPTGEAESGTEEEFNWALESHLDGGWPEIKWFFRNIEELKLPVDRTKRNDALDQWDKVEAFRERLQKNDPPIYFGQYPGLSGFRDALENDLNVWLSDGDRPWVPDFAVSAVKPPAETAESVSVTVPAEFDVGHYRQALVDRFDVLNFEMLDVSGAYYGGVRLWSVFVPQSVRECHEYAPHLLEMPKEHVERLIEKGEVDADELAEAEQMQDERRRQYLNQPVRPVLDVMDDASLNRCVLLGDPGSGKSALLRFLAIRWTRISGDGPWDALSVPLLIELRDYHRWNGQDDKSILRYLQTGSSWHRLNPQTLNHLTENPERVILLLDGLDEIFDPAERALVVDDIQQFSRDFPALRIVVTSRVVGYRPGRLRDAKFRHFMIQDLDESQIDAFLGFWHDVTFDKGEEARQKRERLLQAIRQSKSIAQLAGNPLLLTMMAILNRNQKLPDDRVDLYAQCSRLLLHQWDVERTLGEFPGLSAEIGLREKIDILRTVAYAMQTGLGRDSSGATAGLPSSAEALESTAGQASSGTQDSELAEGKATKSANYIDSETLESLIEDYLHTELHFEQARAVARALVEQLRTRNFILCDLGGDSYAFVHRTFLEYFCAADIVHQFNVTKTLSEQGLIALFDAHCRDDDWREVLRLICGQIDEQFVGRVVELMVSKADQRWWYGITPQRELALAIECLSECRNPARLANTGTLLMSSSLHLLSQLEFGTSDTWYNDIIPACRELGERWPGKQAVFEFNATSELLHGYLFEPWVTLLATVDSDRERLAALVDSPMEYIRASALWHCAEKWPDDATREVLVKRAVYDDGAYPRRAALQALAVNWPDATTRELLTQRALQDKDYVPRQLALEALAMKWPDETTRELLTQRALEDDGYEPRGLALEALAENWPDETSRELLIQRALQDEHHEPRRLALRALAMTWQDETTRKLLTQRALHDEHHKPRGLALDALAVKWPDETTRELLTQRALLDEHYEPRQLALHLLAVNWPDATTRELLTQRALQDENHHPRRSALHSLAVNWLNETTRELLAQRTLQDDSENVRFQALHLLAVHWPDETTRELLAQRTLQDDSGNVRFQALRVFAEKWRDETTRALLTERAIQGLNEAVRSETLWVMAEKWPDEVTREFLTQRAVQDDHPEPRLAALRQLALNWPTEITSDLLALVYDEDADAPSPSALIEQLARWKPELVRCK